MSEHDFRIAILRELEISIQEISPDFKHIPRGLQLKAPFESFIQFLNPANDPIHRSILSLLYFPI